MMRKIVIASHGEFARGLKNSVEMIVGDLAKEIDTYCLYPSCSPRDYTDQMEVVIASHPEDEFIFLCDVKGGSVHTAVSQLCRFENVVVFGGVNMSIVLDLLLSTPERICVNPAIQERLVRAGQEGLCVTNYQKIQKPCEEEDF
ncbi:PTS sugar transporter subunit IIA [uncultured Dubosiella sp.]|uniref:PTS sugar transporter subunit IIA n=3 Tax=uncultured Dubosiella sp. TaxID=1937011 RepID=UPI00267015A6|nr:PTS sugar transporter subunit IIA [uncultured Dubosiella sp.]